MPTEFLCGTCKFLRQSPGPCTMPGRAQGVPERTARSPACIKWEASEAPLLAVVKHAFGCVACPPKHVDWMDSAARRDPWC